MTDEQLTEWRAHPVTEWLLDGMSKHFEHTKEGFKEDFWNGVDISPHRIAVAKAYEQLLETLRDGTAEELAGFSDE